MTSAFSWQNSVSLSPASHCTPRSHLPVTPSLDFSIPVPYDEKDIYFILFLFYFLVSVLESLLGHLKAIELHLLWH